MLLVFRVPLLTWSAIHLFAQSESSMDGPQKRREIGDRILAQLWNLKLRTRIARIYISPTLLGLDGGPKYCYYTRFTAMVDVLY